MFRIPVRGRTVHVKSLVRLNSSSSFIRSTFIDYFTQQHGHKHVKSSSVVPLCDPSVPFVNAGMNQFKAVFLGRVAPPCARAVNSQKCVRVGGKHNDLDVVGADGHHHTFFEMMGNWSFGDYYKEEACKMAWELLLGPYRFRPEELVVTYFGGDAALGLPEDREVRDIWRAIGVPASRLKALGAADNFWEMGAHGPCGPCTEIHHAGRGALTEIWNVVFIQCNREEDGSIRPLRQQHVDTGLGLERVTALAQGVPSNYDTDLFRPIIAAIERNSGGAPYGRARAPRDAAYRRLADHARMLAVCLADGVYPDTSLNLKQILRKSFKISTEVFQNPQLLRILYDEVAASLGPTYPELVARAREVKLILEHEEDAYARMRAALGKRWRELIARFPEADALADADTPGLALGYTEFKQMMAKQKTSVIPGELIFKLYDTHGFQEDIIERIAALNNMTADKEGFRKLLAQHKTRHKTAIKEQTANKAKTFDQAIENLVKNDVAPTNDAHKYNYKVLNNEIHFEPLKTKSVAILDENGEWIDVLEPIVGRPYYIVTKDTNFYCEEGGQVSDSGLIRLSERATLKVDSVFKIRDFVFHKGCFTLADSDSNYVKCNSDIVLEIDSDRRVKVMRNHTAVHLLNAAVRRVLPDSVVCQVGSRVTDEGLSLSLSVYGKRLSPGVLLRAEELVRESIEADSPLECHILDSLQLAGENVLTVPGETYPETGLRVVSGPAPLPTRELCCGTHVPSTRHVREFCVTRVKAGNGASPTIHGVTGPKATELRELISRAHQLSKFADLMDQERRKAEVSEVKRQLTGLCGAGAASAGLAGALAALDAALRRPPADNDLALHAIAQEEIRDARLAAARAGRSFLVHFLRCSYLMPPAAVRGALGAAGGGGAAPALVLGCAGGVLGAACAVPPECVSASFTAERWLQCVLRVLGAQPAPAPASASRPAGSFAEMAPTKVSLITCEQLVQEAMRQAIDFAERHHGLGRGPGAQRGRQRS